MLREYSAGDIKVFENTPSIEQICLGFTKCSGKNIPALYFA